MSEIDLRRVALETMLKVWRQDAYLGPTLDEAMSEYKDMDRRGRAFLTRLCFGTEERLIFLDEVIKSYSSVPFKKIKPVILAILRLSVYQIYYMDGVPDHAIVSEAVLLAKKKKLGNLSGFVNGVLRSVLRDGRDEKPAMEKLISSARDVNEYSLRYSIPLWIIEMWTRDFGEEECATICRGFSKPSPITIWTNTDPMEIRTIADPGGSIEDMEGFLQGEFYVQDESSMQPVLMSGIKAGDKVLDVCAAPGGKSLLAAKMGAFVESRDVSDSKLRKIEENIRRMGMSETVHTKKWDATIADESAIRSYDAVIADLPCSGLGILSKKPEIRYRLEPSDIKSLAELQKKILSVVCEYVKEGGTLIYSTCTITGEENEGVTNSFLREHPQFKLRTKRQIMPEAGGHDGFFVAVINRD